MLVFIGKKYCDISTHKWVFIMQVVSYFFSRMVGSWKLSKRKYSQTSFYGPLHPRNMDISLFWTVCFALRERKPSHFL